MKPTIRRNLALALAAGAAPGISHAQNLIWDSGAPHRVIHNGNTTYLGFSSGHVDAQSPQRWAAVPFEVTQPDTVIQKVFVDFSAPVGSEPAVIRYIIWHRNGLLRPQPGDEVVQGVLGPYAPGQDDPRVPEPDSWLHEYDGLHIPLEPGSYYLTIFGEGIGPGNTTGFSNAAWLTGGDLQSEELEQPYLWRSAVFPSPGFQPFAPSTIQPVAGQDPDDRWNPSFQLFGQGGTEVPVRITRQPSSTWTFPGGQASMSVLAEGTLPITYQWYRNGQPIPGATGPNLYITNASRHDEGKYVVVATNICGQDDSHGRVLRVPTDGACPALPENECTVPDRWKAVPVVTIMDQWTTPAVSGWNKIHDRIDFAHAADQGLRYDIVVDFRSFIRGAHLAFLEDLSDESYLGRSFCPGGVTAVTMYNVSYSEILQITELMDVALVEEQVGFHAKVNTSRQSIRVGAGAHSPNTVQDAYPTIDGRGATVAVLDTGVDDAVNDPVNDPYLRAAAGGFDATVVDAAGLALEVNRADWSPDKHGTHIASIICGRASPLGIAPAARIVDVRVLQADGTAMSDDVLVGLTAVLANQVNLAIDAACMAFASEEPTDGADAVSLMCNMLADAGIVMIAAADSSGGPGGAVDLPPGVAPQVIAVGATDDMATPDRSDDSIAPFSPVGPAEPAGPEQLKPEIVAPGVNITIPDPNPPHILRTQSGTSMSAAHAAGVAALYASIRQFRNAPPSSFFRSAVRDNSYRDLAGDPTDPALDPLWQREWGWGMLDAFTVIDETSFCVTDITFRIEPLGWNWRQQARRNIVVEPNPPIFDQPAVLTASLRNFGTLMATGVQIEWAMLTYQGRSPIFETLGRTPPFTLAGTPEGGIPELQNSPPFTWIPRRVGDNEHQCIIARIVYRKDCNFDNNETRKNVAPTASPVYFFAGNLISADPMRIDFVIDFGEDGAEASGGWSVAFDTDGDGEFDDPPLLPAAEPGEVMLVGRFPVPPQGADDGDTKIINIAPVSEGGCFLGYVSIDARVKDCNGNHIDDWFDIRGGFSQDANQNRVPDECECRADFDQDGFVTGIDFDLYVQAFETGDMRADFDADGFITGLDFDLYVQAYEAGC